MKKVLLYGIEDERLEVIAPIIKNINSQLHIIKNSELDDIVIDILEKDCDLENESFKILKMDVCMFAGFSKEEIFKVIDTLKEIDIKRPVFATATQTNLNWEIGKLILDVNREHAEMNNMK